MSQENALTDIFTEFDKSIFSDGSLDPMGLRIIWTSLGNNIFNNRLNTISTDIRYYTLNLFHHYVIYKSAEKFENKYRILRRRPYPNRSDLYDGIMIFLENLLTHSILRADNGEIKKVVPGINKLKGLIESGQKKYLTDKLTVSKSAGILVRQHLLGISGRHKGPFIQMGILNSSSEDPYRFLKDKLPVIEDLFSKSPWSKSFEILLNLIDTKILSCNIKGNKEIEHSLEDVINPEIIRSYYNLMQEELYTDPDLLLFWKRLIKIDTGTAEILFNACSNSTNIHDYKQIITQAYADSGDDFLGSIVAIEPLLSCIDKISGKIQSSKVNRIDSDLSSFTLKIIHLLEIDLDRIKGYLQADTYLKEEARSRLYKLVNIIEKYKMDGTNLIRELVNYHVGIMKRRGHMPWFELKESNNLAIYKPLMPSLNEVEKLESNNWVNSYYLPTMNSLFNGLYHYEVVSEV